MITAKQARHSSKQERRLERQTAMREIETDGSKGWTEFLVRVLGAGASRTIEFNLLEFMTMFKDNPHWTESKVWNVIKTLGFNLTQSCSSNPKDERWFVKW